MESYRWASFVKTCILFRTSSLCNDTFIIFCSQEVIIFTLRRIKRDKYDFLSKDKRTIKIFNVRYCNAKRLSKNGLCTILVLPWVLFELPVASPLIGSSTCVYRYVQWRFLFELHLLLIWRRAFLHFAAQLTLVWQRSKITTCEPLLALPPIEAPKDHLLLLPCCRTIQKVKYVIILQFITFI